MQRLLIWFAMIGLNDRQAADIQRDHVPPAMIRLSAERVAPQDIRLTWRNPDRSVAGHIVEFASAPDGEYVILAFCPSHLTAFTHERLAPQTVHYYRVRAFDGPGTAPVFVKLPDELTDADYAAAYALPEEYDWAVPARVSRPADVSAARPMNGPVSKNAAAPSDLTATLVPTTVSGFLLTWTDHASDEDGFLLEKVLDDGRTFLVCAYMEPDVNSFGWAFEPPVREGAFRIRAFRYGAPSNIASETTAAAK
jgi:hypothetical protein